MTITRRAWRSVFARADIPADSPFGLDDTRLASTAAMFTVPFVSFGLVTAISAVLVPRNTPASFALAIVALVALAATIGALGYVTHSRVPRSFAARRAAIATPAREAGWTYLDESPLPSPQTLEAVFHYTRDKLIADSFTEVVTGRVHGHTFAAGHLSGRQRPDAGEKTRGRPRSENVVLVALPGLLPELKLRDRSTSFIRDYGWSMAVLSTGDAAFDHRWELQTNHAEFARALLTSPLREFLAGLPLVPCTIVVRNGYIIASRDPEATFSSVSTRLDILTGFIDRIPPGVWEHETTPQEAGAMLRRNYRGPVPGSLI